MSNSSFEYACRRRGHRSHHDGVVSDDWLDRLTGLLNTAMLVVTTQADGQRAGCLVGFATQASISPPRLLVGMSRANHTFTVAGRSEHLALHLLSRADLDLARLFGGETEDEIDKFERCGWHDGPAGMPILDRAVAWLVGKTLERIDLGDHVGYLLHPVSAWFGDGDDLIRFADVVDLDAGHGP